MGVPLFGGSELTLFATFAVATGIGQTKLITVSSPSLIRVNAFGIANGAGTGVTPGNDFGSNRLWAQQPNETPDENRGAHSIGCYLYLPTPGAWNIYWVKQTTSGGTADSALCTIWQNVDPATAALAIGSTSSTESIFISVGAATPRLAVGQGDSWKGNAFVTNGKLARLRRVSPRHVTGGPWFLDFGDVLTARIPIVAGIAQPDFYPSMAAPIIRTTASGTLVLHCEYA